MYKIKFGNDTTYNVEIQQDDILVNDMSYSWDAQQMPNGAYSVISNGKSYEITVDEMDKAAKTISLTINGASYAMQIEEPIDLLLKKLGINMASANKAEAIKAPMPGLVLKILVAEGQSIKKGEAVAILEAMKMENSLKATADATVKAIKVNEGTAVEKGTILIELDN